jgi:hypothetical protein
MVLSGIRLSVQLIISINREYKRELGVATKADFADTSWQAMTNHISVELIECLHVVTVNACEVWCVSKCERQMFTRHYKVVKHFLQR